MISLLLLVISVVIYGIAHEKFSTREGKYIIFGKTGSILCIISLVIFIASTAIAVYNAYYHLADGIN
jgi:hypothetical protein